MIVIGLYRRVRNGDGRIGDHFGKKIVFQTDAVQYGGDGAHHRGARQVFIGNDEPVAQIFFFYKRGQRVHAAGAHGKTVRIKKFAIFHDTLPNHFNGPIISYPVEKKKMP